MALAAEHGMRPDRELDPGVARGAARRTSLALALHARRAALLRACGVGDLDRAPACPVPGLSAAQRLGRQIDHEAEAGAGAAPRLPRPRAARAGRLAAQVGEAEFGPATADPLAERPAEATPEGAAEHLAEVALGRALRVARELETPKSLPGP